jgi:hypothetical protein
MTFITNIHEINIQPFHINVHGEVRYLLSYHISTHKHTQQVNFWTVLYSVHMRCQHGGGCYFERNDPPKSKLSVCVVMKEHINALSVLMNCKLQGYLRIWGCFTEVETHKSL